MPRRILFSFFALLLCLPVRAVTAASAESKVERIEIRLENTSSMSGGMRARVEASVARVAGMLLADRPIARIEESHREYERLIAEVFARILTGYRVECVELEIGADTKVAIRLSPEGPQVEEVRFSPRLSGLPGPACAFLERDLVLSYDLFASIFRRVPVAAFTWAEPVLRDELAEIFSAHFPGFRLEAVLAPAPILEIELRITPLLPTVERVEMEIDSRSLPQLLVARWAEKADASCSAVAGLPLAYVRRRQMFLEEHCMELLRAEEITRRLDLIWRVTLEPGKTARVRVGVETGHYSLALAGRFILGDENALGARARFGIQPVPQWEFAGEWMVHTGRSGMSLSISAIYTIPPDLGLGFTWFLNRNSRLLWLRYPLESEDFFTLEGDLATGMLAASMTFGIEERFSLEFRVDSTREYSLLLEVGL